MSHFAIGLLATVLCIKWAVGFRTPAFSSLRPFAVLHLHLVTGRDGAFAFAFLLVAFWRLSAPLWCGRVAGLSCAFLYCLDAGLELVDLLSEFT